MYIDKSLGFKESHLSLMLAKTFAKILYKQATHKTNKPVIFQTLCHKFFQNATRKEWVALTENS